MRRITCLSLLLVLQACAPRAVDRSSVIETEDAGEEQPKDTGTLPKDTGTAPKLDTGTPVADAATPDSRPPDAGMSDTGMADTAVVDARVVDTAMPDTMPDTMAATPKVLMVVGNATLSMGDTAMKAILDTRKYTVTTVTSTALAAGNITGIDLVLVSQSCPSADTAPGTVLAAAKVPVIVMKADYFDDLKLTGATINTDFGGTSMQTQLTLTTAGAAHVLGAGLTGTVTVITAPHSFSWGAPATAAVKVATLTGATGANQIGIFAYAANATMVGATAQAKRIGFFAQQSSFEDLGADGKKLFEAALDWALGLK